MKEDLRGVIDPVIQRNGYFGPPENLLSMITQKILKNPLINYKKSLKNPLTNTWKSFKNSLKIMINTEN